MHRKLEWEKLTEPNGEQILGHCLDLPLCVCVIVHYWVGEILEALCCEYSERHLEC